METAILAVGLFLLATGVLLPLAEAGQMTVDELQAQLKDFGRKYVEFRKMPNEPAQEKKDALEKLWKIVEDNEWNTDKNTNFCLASIDPATFSTAYTFVYSQLSIIFRVPGFKDDLEGIYPDSLFQDPTTTNDELPTGVQNYPDDIELFFKTKFGKYSGKGNSKVAYHYEPFNGRDLDNPDDPKARKEYALIMFAIATK